MRKIRVGVFDSGVGGLSVANAIEKAVKNVEVICVEDKKNLPYGTKSVKKLKSLVIPILNDLANKVDVIVIACNTVSTVLGEELKKEINVPIIAVVPMIKPAALITKTKVVAVCATPTTLSSPRYRQLKKQYIEGIQVIEPDCSEWSSLIEANTIDKAEIDKIVTAVLKKNADVIVLGCTHYHWIEDEIKSIAGPAITILQPEKVIISEVERELARFV